MFTTAPAPDTLPPTAVSISRAGRVGAARQHIQRHAGPLRADPARTISFILRDANNNAVPASTTYDPSTLSVTLTPGVVLDASSEYTATLGEVEDLAGNPLAAAVTWSFTTGDHIVTAYASIPYFGAHPTIASKRSGPWSHPKHLVRRPSPRGRRRGDDQP